MTASVDVLTPAPQDKHYTMTAPADAPLHLLIITAIVATDALQANDMSMAEDVVHGWVVKVVLIAVVAVRVPLPVMIERVVVRWG